MKKLILALTLIIIGLSIAGYVASSADNYADGALMFAGVMQICTGVIMAFGFIRNAINKRQKLKSST